MTIELDSITKNASSKINNPDAAKFISKKAKRTISSISKETDRTIIDDNNGTTTPNPLVKLNSLNLSIYHSFLQISEQDSRKFKQQIGEHDNYTTIGHIINPSRVHNFNATHRQRRARFRWFLAYTIFNNYHLFDQRKEVKTRLARLRIERQHTTTDQQSIEEIETPESDYS